MIIDKSKTHLVILAGGQSKRFGGGFKTLHKFNNASLLKRILDNFKNLNIDIALNINSDAKLRLLYTSLLDLSLLSIIKLLLSLIRSDAHCSCNKLFPTALYVVSK